MAPQAADPQVPVATGVLGLLTELLGEERVLRDAVVNRDRGAIDSSVKHSERLLDALGAALPNLLAARAAGRLAPDDERRISTLRDELRAAARQNSVVIERAWGTDAATMRLLAHLGAPTAHGERAAAYAASPAPTWIDRSA